MDEVRILLRPRGLDTHAAGLSCRRAGQVESFVRDNTDELRERSQSISRFYRVQGEKNRSRIESLTSTIANGRRMKSVNSIVDAVMISEMRNALPLGLHDLRRIEGDIIVDVARDGETFAGNR